MELTISSTTKESTMEKHSDQKEELPEEEGVVEFTTISEYITCSCYAINTMMEIDTALMSKEDEERIKNTIRRSLLIIDSCIYDLYYELFDEE